MKKSSPYAVDGKVNLLVMNATDGLPAAFALMGTCAQNKVAIRITGGCKGMSLSDKEQMLQFFSDGFSGFRGLIWSGGTRMVNGDEIDPMVTDVPGIVSGENPGCVALGTVPRTDMLTLRDDSRLVLDQWGTVPNPDLSGILIVQNGPDGAMDWDGDLDAYFGLMENWQNFGGFHALGLCSWNGGEITKAEVMRAVKKKWPVFLVKGSGRATDEIIDLYDRGEELLHAGNVFVLDKDDPVTLKNALVANGFMA